MEGSFAPLDRRSILYSGQVDKIFICRSGIWKSVKFTSSMVSEIPTVTVGISEGGKPSGVVSKGKVVTVSCKSTKTRRNGCIQPYPIPQRGLHGCLYHFPLRAPSCFPVKHTVQSMLKLVWSPSHLTTCTKYSEQDFKICWFGGVPAVWGPAAAPCRFLGSSSSTGGRGCSRGARLLLPQSGGPGTMDRSGRGGGCTGRVAMAGSCCGVHDGYESRITLWQHGANRKCDRHCRR